MFALSMSERVAVPDTGGDFRIQIENLEPDGAIVAVAGDADLHSAPELRDRLSGLLDEGVRHVAVDLSETTFVDSMTLGVLLGAVKRLRTSGGRLELIVPRPDIRRIFEITMLDRVFDLHATRDQALEQWSHGTAA